MTTRIALPQFQLANPLYAGAQVTFYTVDEDGDATSTKATLYDAPTGSSTLSNPVTLDSEGKFATVPYTEAPAIIGSVTGISVGDHNTGIVFTPGSWRGNWVTATVYYPGDIVTDGANGDNTGDWYYINNTHTSGTWATDKADSTKMTLALDVSVVSIALSADPGDFDNSEYIRTNASSTAFESYTAAEVMAQGGALLIANDLSDLNDVPTALVNLGLDDVLMADTTQTLSKGFPSTENDYGTISGGGTLTVDLREERIAKARMEGSMTLAPDASRYGEQAILLTTDSTGGYTLTVSGWDKVLGTFDDSADAVHRLRVEQHPNMDILEILRVA